MTGRCGFATPSSHPIDDREHFWKKIGKAKATPCEPATFEAPLLAAFGRTTDVVVARRQAGVGSLGRPRFTAYGLVNSGPFAVEIKASLPSCWEPMPRKPTSRSAWRLGGRAIPGPGASL